MIVLSAKEYREKTIKEDDVQESVFDWALANSHRFPELSLMFAIPNGGLRHIGVARKLKRTGVKSGVPDIFLPVARGSYHGLFIELKRDGEGRVSASQEMWLVNLRNQGYQCVVCYGYDSAIGTIKEYLGW